MAVRRAGKQPGASQPGGAALRGRMAGWLLLASCSGLMGCASFLDNLRPSNWGVKEYFVKEDPLVVLKESTDGNKRAHALASLKEPRQHGGTDREQDFIVELLVTAATKEPQAYCRLSAIQALRTFKDPRVVKGLEDAYYNAMAFAPETGTVIRCQALAALGEIGQPAAVDLLARVAKEPPVEGVDQDKQLKMDERQAAIRALSHYSHYTATTALMEVLRNEKDVAMRDCANQSLQAATGKKLPPDVKAWEELLYQNNAGNAPVVQQQPKQSGVVLTGATGAK